MSTLSLSSALPVMSAGPSTRAPERSAELDDATRASQTCDDVEHAAKVGCHGQVRPLIA
ncbi:MAG: hypothetical protein ABIQ16_05605 [Polyangiaceae bacterium]